MSLGKRKKMSLAGMIIIAFLMLNFTAVCTAQFAGGSGTEDNPYQIETAEHLNNMRNYLGWNWRNAHFIQTADIDLGVPPWNEGEGWRPLGRGNVEDFMGSYNGAGYVIDGLYINRPDDNSQGLFGNVRSGMIMNLGVRDAVIRGNMRCGIIVGSSMSSTMKNCYSTGKIDGLSSLGGLIGFNNNSTFINSYYNYDEVMINDAKAINVGALYNDQFVDWLNNGMTLDIDNYLTREGDHYQINNLSDLKQLLAFGQYPDYSFILKDDIDLAGKEGFHIPYFSGNFDGNEHIISNLKLIDQVSAVRGMFANLAAATVTNLGVTDVVMEGSANLSGGLAGSSYNGTVINNCYSSGTIKEGPIVGGLIGMGAATVIISSHSYGNIYGELYVGGLVGLNGVAVTISDCFSASSVQKIGSNNADLGGLVGHNGPSSLIENSYSTGDVTGGEGLDNIGGLVGRNTTYINNSYSTGNVTGGDTRDNVGGLLGGGDGWIRNSYSTGYVAGDGEHHGGLIGFFDRGNLINSYSTGRVSGSNQYTGGLIGRVANSTVRNCYWDTETSGQTISAGGEGRSTEEMTFPYAENTYVGWDFEDIWEADKVFENNNGYPYFQNIDYVSVEGKEQDNDIRPYKTTLNFNYPNPFNPETTISFSTAEAGMVEIEIFNIRGQKIVDLINQHKEAGKHQVVWNGKDANEKDVAAGVYLYKLTTPQATDVKKMIMIK